MKPATMYTNTSDEIEQFSGAIHAMHDGTPIGVLYLGANSNMHLHSAAQLRELAAVATDLAGQLEAAAAARLADPGQSNHHRAARHD